MKSDPVASLSVVPTWVIACIQLAVLAPLLKVTDDKLRLLELELFEPSSRFEKFALELIRAMKGRGDNLVPGDALAANQSDVWDFLTRKWLKRDPEGCAAMGSSELLCFEQGPRPTNHISPDDLSNLQTAIEALWVDGVNLAICMGDLPLNLIQDGPAELLFKDCSNRGQAYKYRTAHEYLNRRCKNTEWFQVILLSVHLLKGNSTEISTRFLSRMREVSNSTQAHIAEAYDAAAKFEVPA